ncbi:hypothetical protein [Bdellovibrio bacteriovorus]|uniref:hypothetical protein n=1 Tax=Bdellovibrio bacteriovorus TaxID=959 RepID=UPI0035A69493
MKLKTIISSVLMLLLGQAAVADSATLFTCRSLPTADSALLIYGVPQENTDIIDLVIFVNGEIKATDQGILVDSYTRYVGQSFDINFVETAITAKARNPVLSVRQSESLICE